MQNKEELERLLNRVAKAMMDLKNDDFQEEYPIGLIDIHQWEWPQGVGIYGLYKYYLKSGSDEVLNFLCQWFDDRIAEGLPERNVNTTCPLLTLLGLYEITGKLEYRELCLDWSEWVMKDLIRTGDNAFQHMITGDPNQGQILIDTLFMTVLFLSKAGLVFNRPEYIEEAKHQILIHIKYLYNKESGLFYHGYDFDEKHNYGQVHWARGNSWYTCGIVELLDSVDFGDGLREYFIDTLRSQVDALKVLQTESGLWRTVLDDPSSYVESSATAAIGYGVLKAVHGGYLNDSYKMMALKAIKGTINQIDRDGIVENVSYGTPVGNDALFYKNIPVCPMTYGQALTILMLSETLLD